ncbi:MAG TPA: hypothetical protein VGC13_13070 [Longimicrobium sp.]|jgi:hypothetical protein|uniref:hypothetical protein n=1 Tax=Longimicrobium sp. TaxID=2029185 RepID=UPI002EDB5B3C
MTRILPHRRNVTPMRSIPLPRLLPAAACLALAAAPAAAQGLGMVEGVFDEVTAVTVFYQRGWVPSSSEIESGGSLHGGGTEVLINLKSTGRTSYELGLGASYLRGYRAAEPTLDLRASLRALPTVSLYASWNRLLGPVTVYGGASFGLIELWNAQAYDEEGTQWDVEARAFEQGLSLGMYLEDSPVAGLFAEGGYRFRNFHSVKWTADAELPEEWPRSLDFSGPFLSLGWQLQLKSDDEDADDAITPPAPAGTWMLERADGAALPALLDTDEAGRREVLHAVLRLRPDDERKPGEPHGAWILEMNVRRVGGLLRADEPEIRLSRNEESGTYTVDKNVLQLGGSGQAHRLERLAGRLYLQWNGHVLVFAPGSAEPADDES